MKSLPLLPLLRWPCWVVLASLATAPSVAQSVDTSQIRVRPSVAARMTPEQLEAHKRLLARNVANRTVRRPGSETVGETCAAATAEVSVLPWNVSGTTVGAGDNYDLVFTAATPACTIPGCSPTSNGFTGTGTGPDVAYRIRTTANCTLTITATPSGGFDLGLIVYRTTCSDSVSDCTCVDDDGDVNVAETVTLNAVAGTDYFVVIDGYSETAEPPGSSGPYGLSITGSGCALLPVELFDFSID